MAADKIVIIDDERQIRQLLGDRLTANSYQVNLAENGEAGLEIVAKESPDLVFLDLRMPGMDGMEVLCHLTQDYPDLPVIILTAHGTVEKAVEAMKQGAYDFLLKPSDPDHILLVVKKALERKQLQEENQLLREEIEQQHQMVIGESPTMQEVLEYARRVAGTTTTVLVNGESGTGKQLLARAIHRMSERAEKPFVQVNCTTLSEQLLESDLFGHEKGSFTGADEQKKGRVELSDNGTLFLDEIGDLSPAIQAKLLHFLEYGKFERVGGMETLQVDARIISATNKDLKKEVDEGRFRRDLFYRLNVVTLTLPPLRDRIQDIPLLTQHFLKKFAREQRLAIPKITPETLDRLKRYNWPGNIRELENAIERAMVLTPGDEITEDLLPPQIFQKTDDEINIGLTLDEAVRRFKQNFISRTLQAAGNNQTQAAKTLDIQRTYLNRLLKDLEIHPDSNP